VDAAETDRDACFAANATAVAALARVCRDRGIPLVQVSTDYVFGGDASKREPYAEDDPPNPVNAYGASKLAGEEAARGCDHLIVRTCGLYSAGEAGPVRGRNFADTMLVLAGERPELRVVGDQFCTPSYVPHVAAAILALLAAEARGTWHVVNAGATSWHGFAEELLRQAGRGVRLTEIPTSGYPTPARRPGFSVLSTAKLARLGIELPDWRTGIREYLAATPSPSGGGRSKAG
jgi:dTDP-4-dehydrorhamnose reductase